MYFKELEIRGFKSFLNKTKFKFQPGVTAIVGPNGCGKSNVVDAIKWVLGEQSTKSMRSSAMAEVIFNGTEKHDAVNVAEVSLTLSNVDRTLPVDYDEVIIGRRLYRSGESEYLLNKVPVRLSDIRQLIMGTGLGTSSYSVVEQGKLDMLISSKPEARRHVFEEASGITRYKSKKHQAQLKLERTKDNLTRINDIITEVERQIRSIERKARKAERYNGLFKELKDLDLKFASKRYRELDSNENSLGDTGKSIALETEKLAEELNVANESVSEIKQKLKEAVSEVHSVEQSRLHLESEELKNKDFVKLYTERVHELQVEVERLNSEVELEVQEAERLHNRLEGARKRLDLLVQKRKGQEEELNRVEAKVRKVTERMQAAKGELNSSREKLVDIASRRSQLENLMVKIDTDMRNCTARKRRLIADRKDVDEELRILDGEYSEVKGEIFSVEEELERLTEEHTSLKSKCESVGKELENLENELGAKEKELNEIRPRREFLQKLIAQREGIKGSVRKVIERSESGDDSLGGVMGIVSELISVESGYDETLEAVLGDFAQALVVDTSDTASEVMKFLERNELESVSFLVVEELKEIMSCSSQEINKGTLDDITQIFSANEPYASALRTYLSDTFVTVSPEAAQYFVKESDGFRGKIICEKGEVFEKGARRSRNYSKEQTISILGRQEKVNALLTREGELSKRIEELAGEVEVKEAWLRKALTEKEELDKSLRSVERRYSEVSSRKNAMENKLSSLGDEIKLIDTEIGEMNEQLASLNEKKDQTTVTIKEIDAEHSELQTLLENLGEEMKILDEKREKHVFELADVRADFSSLSKEEESLSVNLGHDSKSFDRAEDLISSKRNRVSENISRIQTLSSKVKDLEEKISFQQKELVEKDGELEKKASGRDALDRELTALESTLREKEAALQKAQSSNHDLDMRKKETEYKKRALVESILNSYKTDISSISLEVDSDADWTQISSRIDHLKTTIERMGHISLDAMDEQQELKKRYDFLTEQRDDLVDSKNAILRAIREINSTTKKLFMESFEQIRCEFNVYFRMLFSGGKAELVLQDENDVLECGIDINVRPPGKKLHNVMQLSGGEKAMTAVALIFAIFKVNPSPFCILDEIDAPLDESNIVRFTRVLQDFLKLSQFIVITHNRLTIQLADVLYGVTMQEEGVSKVVSVKFKEEQPAELEGAAAAV